MAADFLGNSRGRERVIRGAIVFGDGAPALPGATVYIRLEDVTEADAPSRLVAQEVVRGISTPPRGGRIPFEIRTAGIDERASYNVSVLVDLDGDGRPSRGDFSSVQSYPVLTHSHPSEVSVEVRRLS